MPMIYPRMITFIARLSLILALASFPVTSLCAAERSFNGRVLDVKVECEGVGVIVSILVTSRENEKENLRPQVEEVRLGVGCPVEGERIKRFILKKSRKKLVAVRFDQVDRGNHPMADILLPGNKSLRALVEKAFQTHPQK